MTSETLKGFPTRMVDAVKAAGPIVILAAVLAVLQSACTSNDPGIGAARTFPFADRLSDYDIFDGRLEDLRAADGYHFVELSTELYTDQATKQRLIALPDDDQLIPDGDDLPDFPDGSMLVKTFYYPLDARDPTAAQNVIETRLLVKADGLWNVATYVWNDNQTDAHLDLDGHETDITWIDADGLTWSTRYQVPSEQHCLQCHQQAGRVSPLGPELRNLNRTVDRDGQAVNQLTHWVNTGILEPVDPDEIATVASVDDPTTPLDQRARAYLAMNCAHCHNPDGWDQSAERSLDLDYETPLGATGIQDNTRNIEARITTGQMPRIGTTLIDQEGVALILDYLDAIEN